MRHSLGISNQDVESFPRPNSRLSLSSFESTEFLNTLQNSFPACKNSFESFLSHNSLTKSEVLAEKLLSKILKEKERISTECSSIRNQISNCLKPISPNSPS